MKLLRGRQARIQRRREIIARLMAIASELSILLNPDKATSKHPAELVNEHTSLCLELTELTAIDDRRIVVSKK